VAERVHLSVEVPGLRVEFAGGLDLFEEVVRDMVSPVARGARRLRLVEEAPAAVEAPAPLPIPSAPPPAPALPTAGSMAFDPTPLYALLAKEGARRAERDAVLLALVAMASAGKRDVTPSEISAHLEASGFPTGDLKARPILAKLSLRKGLAAPGVLPGTFRATPAGVAHILRRSRGG
jgi:hypothetical protein